MNLLLSGTAILCSIAFAGAASAENGDDPIADIIIRQENLPKEPTSEEHCIEMMLRYAQDTEAATDKRLDETFAEVLDNTTAEVYIRESGCSGVYDRLKDDSIGMYITPLPRGREV